MIWWLLHPIRGLLNPIGQGVPLHPPICLHSPYLSHLHSLSVFLVHNSTIIAELKIKSSLTTPIYNDTEKMASTVYADYSIHWVQHTMGRASTHDCLAPLHLHDEALTPECTVSFQFPSLDYWLPAPHSAIVSQGKVMLGYSHGCKLSPGCV